MFESLFFWKEERITKLLRLIHLDVSGTCPQHNTTHVVKHSLKIALGWTIVYFE